MRRLTLVLAIALFMAQAADVRPTIRTIPEGADLGDDFVKADTELAELEIRKAAYQLAKALNTIFTSSPA